MTERIPIPGAAIVRLQAAADGGARPGFSASSSAPLEAKSMPMVSPGCDRGKTVLSLHGLNECCDHSTAERMQELGRGPERT